jgi:hypothetical protein
MMRYLICILGVATVLASPTMAQEREWALDAADEDAFLVFGVPETDDVGVSLWCKIGSNKVKIFFPDGSPSLKPDTKAEFHVAISGKDHVLQGSTSANDMTGETSVETELAIDDALLTELASADRFTATIAEHTMTFPLLEAGVDSLLRLCKAK